MLLTFITKRTFASTPLESLYNVLSHSAKEFLVNLRDNQ